MLNDKAKTFFTSIREAVNFHLGVDVNEMLKKQGQKQSPNMATVLRKVLNSQAEQPIKDRAKKLVTSVAGDPVLQRYFLASSPEEIENFLLLDEPEQMSILAVQSKPPLMRIYEYLKSQTELKETNKILDEFGAWGQRQIDREKNLYVEPRRTLHQDIVFLFTGRIPQKTVSTPKLIWFGLWAVGFTLWSGLSWFLVIPPYIMHIHEGWWIMFLCAVMITAEIIIF
jgi:hypothetical protein